MTRAGVTGSPTTRASVVRRYQRLRDEGNAAGSVTAGRGKEVARKSSRPEGASVEAREGFPSLVMVDGGLGQLHAATAALDDLEITNQPVAAIAKKKEVIYVAG